MSVYDQMTTEELSEELTDIEESIQHTQDQLDRAEQELDAQLDRTTTAYGPDRTQWPASSLHAVEVREDAVRRRRTAISGYLDLRSQTQAALARLREAGDG